MVRGMAVATVAGLEARAGGGEGPAPILLAYDPVGVVRRTGRWMNSGAQGKHRDGPPNKFGGIYAKNSPPNQFGGIYAKDAPVNQSAGVSPDAVAASAAGGPGSRAATSKMSGISLDGLLPEGKGGEIASSVPAEIRPQTGHSGTWIARSVPAEARVQTGRGATWIASSVPTEIRARAQSADEKDIGGKEYGKEGTTIAGRTGGEEAVETVSGTGRAEGIEAGVSKEIQGVEGGRRAVSHDVGTAEGARRVSGINREESPGREFPVVGGSVEVVYDAGVREGLKADEGIERQAQAQPDALATKNFLMDVKERVYLTKAMRRDLNRRALETLKKIEAEGRMATREEQLILAQYTGYGAFGDYAGDILKDLVKDGILTEEEMASILQGLPNAFYTPVQIVRALYELLIDRIGFSGGRVLDPAMGTGAFLSGISPSSRPRNADRPVDRVHAGELPGSVLSNRMKKIQKSKEGFER
jgi:hypothetical protein